MSFAFDPPQFLFEFNGHVSLFYSILYSIFRKLLIHFQTVRNLAFDPVRTNECGPKAIFRRLYDHVIEYSWNFRFWSTFIGSNWIKSEFSKNRDMLPLNSKRNSGAYAKRHAYGTRDYLLHIIYWIKSWTPVSIILGLMRSQV